MPEDTVVLGMTQKEIADLWALFEPMAPKRGTLPTEIKVNRSSINRNVQRRNNRYCSVEGCGTVQIRSTVEFAGVTVAMCDAHIQELERNLGQSPRADYSDFIAKIGQLGESRNRQQQVHAASTQEQAAPYIKAGLAEPFAMALVKSQQPEEILNLWEATWWRQYEPTDLLVTSVLDGTLNEEEARNINEFRGEHPELAMACIKKQLTTEWAQMLLESGFEDHPDAVKNVLEGADPMLIARIRGMDVKNVPPSTGLRILQEEQEKQTPASPIGAHMESTEIGRE
jgi:hypothetical protein